VASRPYQILQSGSRTKILYFTLKTLNTPMCSAWTSYGVNRLQLNSLGTREGSDMVV